MECEQSHSHSMSPTEEGVSSTVALSALYVGCLVWREGGQEEGWITVVLQDIRGEAKETPMSLVEFMACYRLNNL